MSEPKIITFREDSDREMKPLEDITRDWWEFNKNKVSVKYGTYSIEFIKEVSDYRRTAVITYEGESGPHPQECVHSHTKDTTINSTCQSEGVKRTSCTDCGKTIKSTITPIIAHNYTWKDNHDETCTEDGTKTGTCSSCHKTIKEIRVGTALGHQYNYISDNNATCIEDGTETATCPRCGDIKTRIAQNSALGHDFPSNWTIRIPATETSTGMEFRKCKRCDYEESRQIEKLDHTWTSNNDGTHTCTTIGGCGITETCSPNSPDTVCLKCGYHTLPAFRITTETLGSLTVGTSYRQTMTSTTPPSGNTVKWSISAGSIPGLTLSETGVLSGTPTTAGTHTISVKAEYTIDGRINANTKTFTVTVINQIFTVTFNANGGKCNESTRYVGKGDSIGTLPTPTKEGFEFGGWFTANEGGLKVDTNYNVSSNITLYARWGQGSDIDFGEPKSSFNIKYNGGITNYNDNPYTIYHRKTGGTTGDSTLVTQVGISSKDGTNNLSTTNTKVVLYLKVTNNGETGSFDIGFDADSKIGTNDKIKVTRISNGLRFGSYYDIRVPYTHTAWVGAFGERTSNRYTNSDVNANSGTADSGFAFTINNVSITSGSYAILEITFQKL